MADGRPNQFHDEKTGRNSGTPRQPNSSHSPDAIPLFAIAFPFAILAPMPTLEKNATQPGLIAQDGNVLEITRRLAVMNLALRGIEADFGPEHADTFRRDLHLDLRADYVLANPPFNDSDWFRKDDDVRCFSLYASNG